MSQWRAARHRLHLHLRTCAAAGVRLQSRPWLGAAVAALGLAGAGLGIATRLCLEPLPATLDPTPAAEARARIVDRNGVPLNMTYDADWNVHDTLPLHKIPPFLRAAFIHAEDKRFYAHHGPDWLARLAALATNLRNLDGIRGASTITEQVVRMLHPRRRTVWARWLEGFEAAALERRFGKDEILGFYLNQVPYASNRRGVRQAAELYFARDLATLSDREMLALAVLVRSPSRLDLRRDTAASAAAVDRLADLMLARGALDADRYRALAEQRLVLADSSLAVSAPHFVRFALEQAGATRSRVVSTLDVTLQSQVQGLLDSRLEALARLDVGNGAVLVVDNATREVLAWAVADREAATRQIDAVTAPRQPGSALKPMLYALALERGATLADIIVDAPLTEDVGDGLHRYHNYSDRNYGPVSLREALANSLNIPAVKLLHGIGAADYLRHLEALGFTSLTAHPEVYGDGLALGNGEVTLLELVQGFVTLADRGVFAPLEVLRDGREPAVPVRVVSPETASLIAAALSDADARAAEFGRDSVLDLPVQTAVKTGTSSDYRDAWTVGFDSRFTVGVWMGNLDRKPMAGVTGSIGPALVLRSVFAYLNRDRQSAPLFLSPKLTRREVCVPSPARPGLPCLARSEWFDPAQDRGTGGDAVATALPSPPAGARSPEFRFRQPTDGLELAFDPRLPAESQAFRFLIDGVSRNDRVEWSIDGKTAVATGTSLVWPVVRGRHELTARIYRDGEWLATLAGVEFRVR